VTVDKSILKPPNLPQVSFVNEDLKDETFIKSMS
jgi:hypothetical protein